MKLFKKVSSWVITLVILACIFFAIDYSKVQSNKEPIFCIPTEVYKDGGSTEYMGLGYKVIKYVKLSESKATNQMTIKMEIGSWFMKFNNTLTTTSYSGTLPADLKDIKFESQNIQSHLYIEGLSNKQTDIIRSRSDLNKYLDKYQDNNLKEKLSKYTDKYFNNKVLVIVTLVETSGSNSNEVNRVSKLEGSNLLDIFVKRTAPEIGTADMAMWHLIIELDKDDAIGVDKIVVHDANLSYQ